MGFSVAGAIGLTAAEVGATAATVAGIGADVAIGAGIGALGSEVTGGDPGKGALFGGISGGFGGVGGLAGPALGIGSTAGSALGAAAGGALGAGVTGGNPLTGALEGGASSLALSGLESAVGTPAGAAPASGDVGSAGGGAGGPTVGAAGTAAPSSVPLSSPDASLPSSDAVLNAPSGGGGTGNGVDISGGGAPIGGSPSGVSAPASAQLFSPSNPVDGGAPAAGSSIQNQGFMNNVFGNTQSPTTPTSESFLNQASPSGGGGTPGGNGISISGTPLTSDSSMSNLLTNGTTPTVTGNATSGTGGGAAPKDTGLFGEPGSFLNKISGPSSLGPLVAAGGLGLEAIRGNQTVAGQPQVSAAASQLASQGATLQGYLNSGTLPPGVQTGIDSALKAAQASIRSQYASRGMSGSSAEAQDLANAGQVASTQGANIAMSLLNTGISETQLSSQLYTQIMNEALAQDQQLGSAIGNFASALAGGGTTVRLGTTSG